jgi:peptidoglycan biosynthesis protein MviN/MurJ (putative lipid II flippase)
MKQQLLNVALLTALSQGAAFIKLWFVARQFGIGSELDGYNLALVVPTFIAGIASGLIQTGFFPVRSSFSSYASSESLAEFERSIFWVSIVIGLFGAILVAFVSPFISVNLVSVEQVSALKVINNILPYVAILILLNIATDTMGYILAMHNRFVFAAAAPIANGLLGAAILIIWPEYGLVSLVLGTILGVLVQLGVCVIGLKSVGFVFFGQLQNKIEFKPLAKKMFNLSFWILPGVIVSNITASMPMVWAAQFGEGAASAFGYAYRFHTSIVQLLIMASSTIILAHFSIMVVEKNESEIKRFLMNSAILSFGFGIFALVFVWIFGAMFLSNFFVGRFDVTAAEKVGSIWVWLTIGIAFTLLGNVYAKLWQAQGRVKLMSAMAFICLLVMILIYHLTKNHLYENSIGLALSGASCMMVLAGVLFLKIKK